MTDVIEDRANEDTFAQIQIRYEGGDADAHEIELHQLGESLQGFGRIIAVAGHFERTGQYNKQYGALAVRVVAREPDEHRCFEVWATVKPIVEAKEFWTGVAGAILTPVLAYIFSRKKAEEMKHLAEALQTSLGNSAKVTEGLLEVVSKLAESLRPAARQALRPIGDSCSAIKVTAGTSTVTFDESTKAQFEGASPTIGDSRTYVGVISEMDKEASTCKVLLRDESARINARITDPVATQANSVYAVAFASGQALEMVAKAEFDDDGNVIRLHISDAKLMSRDERSAEAGSA